MEIKDCEWLVSLKSQSNWYGSDEYKWRASTHTVGAPLYKMTSLWFEIKREAIDDWKKFAKENKIKKWRRV